MNESILSALKEMSIQSGESIEELSQNQPVFIVFLRHFGCIFCMEAMNDIAKERTEIESRDVKIVLVHMASPDVAESYFQEYNLSGIDHISDPECQYYEAFGLVKGSFNQLFGLKVWLRTAQLTIKDLTKLRRKQIGDGFQMPGAFLIHNGELREKYIHSRASDRPDYLQLTACCSSDIK